MYTSYFIHQQLLLYALRWRLFYSMNMQIFFNEPMCLLEKKRPSFNVYYVMDLAASLLCLKCHQFFFLLMIMPTVFLLDILIHFIQENLILELYKQITFLCQNFAKNIMSISQCATQSSYTIIYTINSNLKRFDCMK